MADQAADTPAKRTMKAQPKSAARRTEAQRAQLAEREEKRRRERLADAQAEARAEEASNRHRFGYAANSHRAQSGPSRAEAGRDEGNLRPSRSSRGGFAGSWNSGRPAAPPIAPPARPAKPSNRREHGESIAEPAQLEDEASSGEVRRVSAARKQTTTRIKSEGASTQDGPPLKYEDMELSARDAHESGRRGINVNDLDTKIYILSDDEEDEAENEAAPAISSRAQPAVPKRRHLAPLRVQRKPHVERQADLNTDITSETLEEPGRKGEKGEEDEDTSAVDGGRARRAGKERKARTTFSMREEVKESEKGQQRLESLYSEFQRMLSGEQPEAEEAFLIQLPSVLPRLRTAASQVKQESGMEASGGEAEDEEGSTGRATSGAHTRASERMGFPAGRVGRLRLCRDGRSELTWGGVDMKVSAGTGVGFLQTVVMTSPAPPTEQAGPGGRATSFGNVQGKLVVTPDWDKVFGKAAYRG